METLLLPLLITALAGSFWLWMAWDLGGNNDLSDKERSYWMLAFLFMNVFAAAFYYITEYKKRHS